MTKKIKSPNLLRLSVRSVIVVGLVLMLIVTSIAGHFEMMSQTKAAESAMDTLKSQCISFDKLMASDRTKSLFRLTDMMRNLRHDVTADTTLISDTYLEEFVDSMRITGVAVLDAELELVASGYTRQFHNDDWTEISGGNDFDDIVTSPEKVFATRIKHDGQYYDICALGRIDAPGVLVGYYRQPTGLISDTENDLVGLLGGLHLEGGGRYTITEGEYVRVCSNQSLQDTLISDSEILQKADGLPNDGRLHLIHAEGKFYFCLRSTCEGYVLYIYYPLSSVLPAWLAASGTFAGIYLIVCFVYFAVRNRTFYANHRELQESNRHLTETVNMLQALETIYFTLFYVDLKNDTYDAIYIAPWLKSAVPEKGVYTELKRMFVDTMIVEAYRDEVDSRMSPEFIKETLSMKNITDVRKSFYTDYQAIRGDNVNWCRVSATPIDFDDAGDPIHVLAFLQDVDVEKAREAAYQEQILKESDEAKIANSAKSEFLRRMSHDLRTPINGIKGYISIASKHPEDVALQNYCREKALASTNVLTDLVNGLLEMSKLQGGNVPLEKRPFDLSELLDGVNTICSPQAIERNINYEILHGKHLPVSNLIGSPRYLTQVIMNMTTNAIKFTEAGGTIRVNSEIVSQTETEVTYEFICADNGVGMTEEFQAHMFEPFTQETISARTVYEGSGLGLSIMKTLVEAMGGTVTYESKKGVGTTFRVRLTFLIDRSSEKDEDADETSPTSVLSDKNVLLVEDNELNMEIADMLLCSCGANVTKAWNGKEAVERFAESEVGYFDLIFMDIMMPEMDGLEAARRIRALDRPDAGSIPISAMSANAFSDDVQKSTEVGMNGYISKPVDEHKFLDTAKKLLGSDQD